MVRIRPKALVPLVLALLPFAAPAEALLSGDEVTMQRVFDVGNPDYIAALDEATFAVGPGSEFQSSVMDVDVDDDRITLTTLADTSFGSTIPHEFRFFVSPRITGFSLTTSNFGNLSDADISFSEHVLRINVSGLDPDFPGSAEILLVLEPTPAASPASVPAVSPFGLSLLGLILAGAGFFFLRRAS